MQLRKRTFNLVIILGFVIIVLLYFIAQWALIYCNDAYIKADVIQITSQVSGFINQVYVKDNQYVYQNQKLIQLDQTSFLLQVQKQQALLQQAQQQLTSLQTSQKGMQTDGNAQTKQMLNAQSATVQAIDNELQLAKYNLSQTEIHAVNDGYINNLNVYKGDYVTAGQPLFGLVDNHSWRVVANYESNQITHIHIGDTALIYISGHPFRLYRGRVVSIGRAVARLPTAGNAAVPYIPPLTNWIRYPYRFPVRIEFSQPLNTIPLYMGADVRTIIL